MAWKKKVRAQSLSTVQGQAACLRGASEQVGLLWNTRGPEPSAAAQKQK